MIKKTAINGLIFAILPIASYAQFGNMSEAQIQQMMQQSLKIQDCFSQIDAAELERLSERGQAVDAEISALCKAGNRSKAQSRAIDFALEMAKSPAVDAFKQCGEGIANSLPKIVTESENYEDSDTPSHHVCDDR